MLNMYLRFVPFLGLLDVFGGQILVLQTDVPQGRRQVRFSHLHVHLHMLLLMHLILQLQHFLQYNQCSWHVQTRFETTLLTHLEEVANCTEFSPSVFSFLAATNVL